MQFIWIVGPSAVGKATFIRKVMEEPDGRARVALCIPPDGSCAQAYGTDAAAVAARTGADHILIKWQNVDNDAGREVDLTRQFQDDVHRLVVLWVSPEVWAARHPQRYQCDETTTDGFTKLLAGSPSSQQIAEAARGHWETIRRRIERPIHEMPGVFRVAVVDGSTDRYPDGADHFPLPAG